LRFNGTCREAMTFYKDCLGGELTWMTVAESPMAARMPPEAQQKLMHATLTTDHFTLMGSDMVGPQGLQRGNSFSLSLHGSSEAETRDLFSKLAAGGQITYPLTMEFWGGMFGTLVDKFGHEWLFNFETK
jgi:PhnB protein